MPDITIDGTSITDLTIDGTQVTEVTIDGTTVWTSSTTTYVEKWPSGDLSEYTGDTGLFVLSAPPAGGPQVNNVLEPTGTGYDEIYRTSPGGNQSEITRGNRYKMWVYNTTAGVGQFSLRFASDSTGANCYEIRYEPNQDDFGIFKWAAGAVETSSFELNVTEAYPGGEWWYFTLDYGATTTGDITAELFNAAGTSLTTQTLTDSGYTGGYIGFRPSVDGTMYLGPVEVL